MNAPQDAGFVWFAQGKTLRLLAKTMMGSCRRQTRGLVCKAFAPVSQR